ncbi:MAG: TolC family protein [Dokdonella sp.]|nr:TolC family protein [Dokdonella sp.]
MFPFRLPRRCTLVRLTVAVSCAIYWPIPAHSAEIPPTLAPPEIRQAVKGAWQQHPSYRINEALIAAANARFDAASKPLYNPELEVLLDREGPDRSAVAGVNLTLDLSGKRRLRHDAAEARVDLATAEARVIRREFTKQWFEGWADYLAATQRVEIGNRRLQLVSRFADLAERQYAADDISGLDRDLASLASEEARLQQSQLLADQTDAEARFREVGGTINPATGQSLPTSELPAPVAYQNASLEELPDWQVAQATAKTLAREVLVARQNRVADPTVGINGGRIDYGSFRDNVIGVRLSVPLFVRNSFGAEVVAAQADANAADAEVERVVLQLDTERRRAITTYDSSRTAWSRWQASRGTDVELRAGLLERLWKQGELSTSDYLLQLKQTLDTALAGAELEARVWRGFVEYLAATGQLERWSGLEGTP